MLKYLYHINLQFEHPLYNQVMILKNGVKPVKTKPWINQTLDDLHTLTLPNRNTCQNRFFFFIWFRQVCINDVTLHNG